MDLCYSPLDIFHEKISNCGERGRSRRFPMGLDRDLILFLPWKYDLHLVVSASGLKVR